jgi:hypothetical protein
MYSVALPVILWCSCSEICLGLVKDGQGLSKGAYMVPLSSLYPLYMLFSTMAAWLPRSSPNRLFLQTRVLEILYRETRPGHFTACLRARYATPTTAERTGY